MLTGLAGVFTNILKGNGAKAIESTLNFFPPSQREKAKEQYNTIFLGLTTPKPNPNATTVTTTTVKTTTEEEEYEDDDS